MSYCRVRNIVAGIATFYGLGCFRFKSGADSSLFLLHRLPDLSWSPLSLLTTGNGAISCRQSGRGMASTTHPSSEDFENEWSCTSVTPLCQYGMLKID